MTDRPLIDRICLRAQDDNGNWGSFTLRECWDDCGINGRKAVSRFIADRSKSFDLVGLDAEGIEKIVKKFPANSYVALK